MTLNSRIWDEIIQKFLVNDDDVSELETNGTLSVFIRKKGKRIEIKNVFQSVEQYNQETIELAKFIAKSNDKQEFLTEGKIKIGATGGARVHIVLPPASDNALVTIAKKTVSLTTLESIYQNNSMSIKMFNFLKAAVDCKLTMVLSGSTGAGKTTILEALTKFIPHDTRIGVVEDSPELVLIQPNVVYLHSMPWKPGMDKNKEVTLDWCMRQINRQRTDLVIIGETRGSEFKQFITAANSGMEGSMTTLHANSPKLALQKMNQFIAEAQDLPTRLINTSIASSIDIIIQLSKSLSGEYKTTTIEEVSEILGKDENATIATTNLSSYDEQTKTWSDKFLINDKIRKKFESKGYDCSTFIKRNQLPNFSSQQMQGNQNFFGYQRTNTINQNIR